jgi:hypothetical protein
MRFVIFLPNTKAISEPLFEVAFIMASILPEVFAVAIWQSIHIQACIRVSISESLHTLAVFESVPKLTMVNVT